ncbi:MAG TPA: metalloregulator ArsR/SmtB family transcription factor, partial [Chloroflexota bacterium]|nr:metalloregulator ArsR/SmtB family transcription factor [Chloroflexota bacterium]
MEDVFKAIADPVRRTLLDRLFRHNGLTLSDLCDGLTMTRFGVMKHLRILEAAGLVATRKVGRKKRHYLNPVPIRLIHDRWVSKYTGPMAAALIELKSVLEGSAVGAEAVVQVYQIVIRTTPERL